MTRRARARRAAATAQTATARTVRRAQRARLRAARTARAWGDGGKQRKCGGQRARAHGTWPLRGRAPHAWRHGGQRCGREAGALDGDEEPGVRGVRGAPEHLGCVQLLLLQLGAVHQVCSCGPSHSLRRLWQGGREPTRAVVHLGTACCGRRCICAARHGLAGLLLLRRQGEQRRCRARALRRSRRPQRSLRVVHGVRGARRVCGPATHACRGGRGRSQP